MKKSTLIILIFLFATNYLYSQVADAGADQVVCVDTTTLAANNPTPDSGQWSVVSGSAVFQNSTLYNTKVSQLGKGKNELLWLVTNASSQMARDTVNITYLVADAGDDFAVTFDNAQLNAFLPAGFAGYWEVFAGNGVFDDEAFPNTMVVDLKYEYNIFQWNVSATYCTAFDRVVVTRIPYAGPDITIPVTSTSLAAELPPDGAVGEWTIMFGTGDFDDTSSPNATISNIGTSMCILRWTVTFPDSVVLFDELTIDITSEIKEFVNQLQVFPNPSEGDFSILLPERIYSGVIKIYNIDGKEIYSELINNQSINFDFRDFEKGIYFISLQTEKLNYKTKIIIK